MANILIGIDPGVKTGLAVWDKKRKRLVAIETVTITKAIDWVRELITIHGLDNVHVRFEDARKRTWFGSKSSEVLQGVGSVKRDSSIWEELLTGLNASWEAVPPKDNMTKTTKEGFLAITGYSGRTSEHARDAAMLVFGF
ncbi:MAG: hypothetical protein ACRCZM_11810 [Bacteroidales bacterium]